MTYGELVTIVGGTNVLDITVKDINENLINPDTLTVTFRAQGQPAVVFVWTNPPGSDPENVIVNVTTGSFTADYKFPNSGNWTYQVSAQPLSGLDTTATSWIVEGEILVSASAV